MYFFKNSILIFLFLFSLIGCKQDASLPVKKIIPSTQDSTYLNDKISNTSIKNAVISKTIILGDTFQFLRNNLTHKELKLSFKKINAQEFNAYKDLYRSKIEIDSTKEIDDMGGTFLIDTSIGKIQFGCGKNYERPCYHHLGYLIPLNSHIIGQWGESIFSIFLVDKNNVSRLDLLSEFDAGSGMPLVSPLHSKLLTYASTDLFTYENYYDIRSNIIIYDLRNINHLDDIQNIWEYTTRKFEIIEAIWINENSLSLWVCDDRKNDQNGKTIYKNERYLKAVIQ